MIEALPPTDIQSLFGSPPLNHVASESPFAADPEAGNLTLFDQPANRQCMDSQYGADFLYRQKFMVACHRDLTLLPLCQKRDRLARPRAVSGENLWVGRGFSPRSPSQAARSRSVTISVGTGTVAYPVTRVALLEVTR
jgi:hypothetical protein